MRPRRTRRAAALTRTEHAPKTRRVPSAHASRAPLTRRLHRLRACRPVDTADEVALLLYREESTRGHVKCVGMSEPMVVRQGSAIRATVAHGGEHKMLWEGEAGAMTFPVDLAKVRRPPDDTTVA